MLLPFLVLIAAVTQADADGRGTLAGRRVMRLLGEWSFSFYLVHQVVLSTTLWLVRQIVPPDAVFVVAVPVAGAASLLIAVCLYHWMEKPLEKRWRHARPRPGMSGTCS